MDRLDALFRQFQLRAELFHAGALCGINDFDTRPGLGQLHLVRKGPLRVEHRAPHAPLEVDGPSLLLYPRPLFHRFISDAQTGADMVCAMVVFSDAEVHPLALALPPVVHWPLEALPAAARTLLDVLFEEAFQHHCGRQTLLNRLFEAILIHLLRELLARGSAQTGLLAGLADRHLAPVLVALHEHPEQAWTLPRMAAAAHLSRSRFAAHFHTVVGTTPADYLLQWRLLRVRQLQQRGQSLKQIAPQVGYGSGAALSRAMRGSADPTRAGIET